jgi:quinol monooxygenase YgiN
MLIVLASITVKNGKREQFLEVFKANVPMVRAEEGCVEYAPTVDFETGLAAQKLDDQVVTIVEKWQDIDSLRAHLKAPHMLEYREKVKDLVEEMSLKVLQEA